MKKLLPLLAVAMFSTSIAFGQVCNTYTDGPWINFNNLGGAPCTPTPPSTTEITGFEIWGGEAYAMNNVKAGGQYRFGACNSPAGPGTGGQAWNVAFTIVAPSGAIDASGRDAGSNCALSWTASETGEYTIIVYQVNNCGAQVLVNNGYPSITYLGGASCDPPITACEAGTLNILGTDATLCPGESTTLTVTGMIIPNSPTLGGAGVQFAPVNASSTGGLGGQFVVSGYDADDFTPYSIDNDIQGVLSFNGFPPLSGQWELMPYVYDDASDVFSKCDSTASTIVDFLPSGAPGCAPFVCESGDVTVGNQAVCPGEDVSLAISGEELPVPASIYWFLLDTNDVSGDNDLILNFGSDPAFYNFTGDLNGLLALNEIDTLTPSVYFTFAGIFHGDSICDLTDTGFYLTILSGDDPECGGVVPCAQPYPAPTNPQALVTQSPAGVLLSWDPVPGSIGCQIKAGKVGGSGTATITMMSPELSEKFIGHGQMVPGTTYHFRVRCGCTLQVISPFSTPVTWTYTNFPPASNLGAPNIHEAVKTKDSFIGEQPELNARNILDMGNVSAPESLRGALDQLRADYTAAGILPGAKAVNNRESLAVFPNPSTGTVNVKFYATQTGEVEVRIHDVVGKLVFAKKEVFQAGSNVVSLDLSHFEKGIYILELDNQSAIETSKMVIE